MDGPSPTLSVPCKSKRKRKMFFLLVTISEQSTIKCGEYDLYQKKIRVLIGNRDFTILPMLVLCPSGIYYTVLTLTSRPEKFYSTSADPYIVGKRTTLWSVDFSSSSGMTRDMLSFKSSANIIKIFSVLKFVSSFLVASALDPFFSSGISFNLIWILKDN